MKTIFDQETSAEIIDRINKLNNSSVANWGKMNVFQMLKHCALAEEMYLGKRAYPRTFLGRIIGKFVLKGILKDETPMGKNAPTNANFIVEPMVEDIETLKTEWISLLEAYQNLTITGIDHWFFGKMNRDQVGYFVYKHADHHLRQFGV